MISSSALRAPTIPEQEEPALTRTIQFVCLLICLSIGWAAQAKTLADRQKVDQLSEQFMAQLAQGETENAYTLLSAYLGVDFEQFNQRARKVAQDMKMVQQSTGKALSYDLLKTQSVKDHFYKVSYLLKFPSAALIWELNYYQPESGWVLVDVSYNADINALFE